MREAVDDLVVRARGTLTPGPGTPGVRLSAEALAMSRDDTGAIRGSRRLPGGPPPGHGAPAAVRALLDRAARALAATPLQSVLAEVRELPALRWRWARVLARVETPSGPMLTGVSAPSAAGAALPDLDGRLLLPPCEPPGPPPPGWEALPLLLRPAVAAAVVAGTSLVLTSPAARSRHGRRVLPALTLTDLPTAHPEPARDDAARPASAIPLVAGGVLCPPPREPATGALPGRAVWDHDLGALVPAPLARVRLSGLAAVPEPDGGFAELVWPVEGLRRYHPGGGVRLICLARVAHRPREWFAVRVRARPQALLRAVSGAAGEPVTACADADVTTPSLLLPSARELAAEGKGTIAAL
ncbi:hypothetical protein HNP84_004120 [Thermocatellispora tengchongensis]|uniref:Uncharacterized protein n=1 Tax=Thermocatellispora tengchongensis TaxID=1073253 RepID=A0A840P3Y9_9ACTN|nr:hypothetical protein [Thermocatellispora tengchongensis]MBB5134388.1 hypothetical protein [Thermocatellispora tengchongensis]